MKTIDSTNKVKTKLIKTAKLSNKNKLTIERILTGVYKGQYTVKSYTKCFFSFKPSTLAGYNLETDFNGDKVIKIDFPVFEMMHQASLYLKTVKLYRYKSEE